MIRFFFFSIGTIFREIFVVLLTIADLGMIMPSTTWSLLDVRVAEKEKLLNQYFVRSALVITTMILLLYIYIHV